MEFKDIKLEEVGREIMLVGGVWAGNGTAFVCVFPEYDQPGDDDEVHVLQLSQDEWQQLLRQSDLMEAEVLAQAADGKLYKAIARKSQRNVDQGVSWNVFRRDGYRCCYCGNDKVPLTVDHLVLWEEGGPSTEENLLAACRKCNKRRGNTQYADWLKHPHYLKVSQNLTSEERERNAAIVPTLDAIPRVYHKEKRKR